MNVFKVEARHKVYSKEYCCQLAQTLGVSYGGIGYNRHMFEAMAEGRKEQLDESTWRIIPRTFGLIECTDEDIENGNLPYFVKHKLTHPSTPQEIAFFETDAGMDLLDQQ